LAEHIAVFDNSWVDGDEDLVVWREKEAKIISKSKSLTVSLLTTSLHNTLHYSSKGRGDSLLPFE
jgi:hypothetical protein